MWLCAEIMKAEQFRPSCDFTCVLVVSGVMWVAMVVWKGVWLRIRLANCQNLFGKNIYFFKYSEKSIFRYRKSGMTNR